VQKKLFEDMQRDVAKKEALKLKKRESKDDSTKQKKPKIDKETKKTQATSRKISAIKKSAEVFSQSLKKAFNHEWDTKDKKQIKKDLQDVIDTIQSFLDEKKEASMQSTE
jgi:hypothetical protein